MARQIGHRHRIHLVEVVENARLVGTQLLARLGVAHVPGVAREEHPRICLEYPANVTIAYFTLLCQTKVSAQETGVRA